MIAIKEEVGLFISNSICDGVFFVPVRSNNFTDIGEPLSDSEFLIVNDWRFVRESGLIEWITVNRNFFTIGVTISIDISDEVIGAMNVFFLSFSQPITIEVLFPVISQVDSDDCRIS